MRNLEYWSPDDSVCEFTIYGISPNKDYKNNYWKDRFKLFIKDQIDLILYFLRLVEKDDNFNFIFSQVKRSPERILKLYEKNYAETK
jgi:hypothetical protein